MQDSVNAYASSFGDHRPRVVFRVPRVHDDGAAQLRGERELLRECEPLLEPRRVVIVVVEPALSDCSGSIEDELTQRWNVARSLKSGRIVWVDAGRMPEIARITRGDRG